MRRALLLLLTALAALTAAGCGGSETTGFSDADRELIAELEADTLAYQAAADRITQRFEDPGLGARRLRAESREDVEALHDISADLTAKTADIEHDGFRSLAEPAAAYYVNDAAQVKGLLDAYAEEDGAATAELAVAAERAKATFLAGQRRRLAALEDELPEDEYARLRAAFETG